MEKNIFREIKERVLVLDGAMGTMIQRYNLDEKGFRGERFNKHPLLVKGNNDLLCLTQPQIIRDIHEEYLEAGADIIETNTFNANRISMSDYQMESLVPEINRTAAAIAVETASHYTLLTPEKPRFVAGSIGPTNKTASLSPNVNNPAFRAVTFDDLYLVYHEQISGLIEGGVDLLLIETIFDTLNAKAALMAAFSVMKEKEKPLPIMISGTIADASGRTLSGQTVEAFLISLSHPGLFSIGLNCSLGARDMRPFLETLSREAPYYISVYPNAGLPDQFGEYKESPEMMSSYIRDFLDNRFVNIIGGCCGTTPDHIRMFAKLAKSATPRQLPDPEKCLRLSGLEPLTIYEGSNFINIGERTNVSGSRKFARLIREGKFEEALSIARQQVDSGAQVIDINMDDPLLDAEKAMATFLNTLASDPDVSRVPVMIDSSRWPAIETGLKCIQGKPIVNSISLKEGEKIFLERAEKIRNYGAALIVMAFDEKGQATDYESKIRVCKRAYDLLTGKIQFPPEDIIFDPNILTLATGMEEHNHYAVDFIRATQWIKENLPWSHVSGGISNLSFAFRGNDYIREIMHSVFLFHAIHAGLDMGIVNAGNLPVYDDIPPDILEIVEDVILDRRKDAVERLIHFAEKVKSGEKKEKDKEQEEWRNYDVRDRLKYALIKGNPDHIDEDIAEALGCYDKALKIIEGPLMEAMNKVGDLFGSGKMFLPQVVKSARVMKKAVSILLPIIEQELSDDPDKPKSAGKILLATVKGDVHDIGKNIVGVILACNNYKVVDLGVMVPSEKILAKAVEEHADAIGLSGLITPSLDEMVHVAREMQRLGFTIPLLIGGATTSDVHTAVKIDSQYSGPVIHIRDASKSAGVLANLISPNKKEYTGQIKSQYKTIRRQYESSRLESSWISLREARENRLKLNWDKYTPPRPSFTGNKYFLDYPLDEIYPYIDWSMFFHTWKLNGHYPALPDDTLKGKEAKKLFKDANVMLDEMIAKKMIIARGVIGFYPANAIGDDIGIYPDESRNRTRCIFRFLRNQEKKGSPNLSLSDFIAPREKGNDYFGFFTVTAGLGIEEWVSHYESKMDDYSVIMIKALADRLAEAFAERMHQRVRKEFWGYSPEEQLDFPALLKKEYQGIRPAPGYPACPEHSEKKVLFDLLDVEKNTGIRLTENYAMYPASSISGFYFSHPDSSYFTVGKIGKDQIQDYAKRKNISLEMVEKLLNSNLNY
ncbi:MAG: methionine synthase [Bacteroidota bacterium]|nr:methionine synthase [Bacteroidota bacterium]